MSPAAFLSVCLLLLAAACSAEAEEVVRSGPPNVVLILCDDAGYGDLGCYGSARAETPNIDALAQGGVRFTRAYVAASSCSPSRAGLVTGRHPSLFGYEYNIKKLLGDGADLERFGLPSDETTVADGLRERGYRTAFIGKWHLGRADAFHPLERGFDEFFGFLNGPAGYWGRERDLRPGEALMRGRVPTEEPHGGWAGHLLDVLVEESTLFIDRERAGPFFLFLSLPAPHAPLHPKPEHLERFVDIDSEQERKYMALIATMDESVGAVLDHLRERGLERETLVAFLSDNGAVLGAGGSNGVLRDGKGSHFDGGVRVPFVMQWPGTLPAGVEYDEPVSSLDIAVTALALAGDPEPTLGRDGVDLVPFLSDEVAGPPHETLFWGAGRAASILSDGWKLVTIDRAPRFLFHIPTDEGERVDRLASEPELAAQLATALEAWEATRPGALWTLEQGLRWVDRPVEEPVR